MKLHYHIHGWFPSLCLRQAYYWEGNRLVCPVCERTIAYAYPLHGKMYVQLCSPYCFMNTVFKISPPPDLNQSKEEVEDIVQSTIEALHRQDPQEPLMSDRWDDEAAYQQDIRNQIQINNQKIKTEKESD